MEAKKYFKIKEKISKAFTPEAKNYFDSLEETKKQLIEKRLFEEFTKRKRARKKGEDVPKIIIGVSEIKSLETYNEVRGYSSPLLIKRKLECQERPATLFELKMGCYIEQIEKQTRESLIILRKKGYNTLESGFHNKLTGSQFFHFGKSDFDSISKIDFEDMNDWISGVEIRMEVRNESPKIVLTPITELNLGEWSEVLNAFAEKMPVIRDKEVVAVIGASISFAFEQTQILPKSHFYEMAKDTLNRNFIDSLYKCETEYEVETLYKEVNDDFLK